MVVLFYTPGSNYDTIQAREARAGAAAGGAGFLAVDVPRDREVASLAAAFEIRDAPALLVVKQGFRVAVQIGGYADRETVAQAERARMSSVPEPQFAPDPGPAGAEIAVHSAKKDGREVVRPARSTSGGPGDRVRSIRCPG